MERLMLDLKPGRLSPYGRHLVDAARFERDVRERGLRSGLPPMAGGGGFSDAYETKVLEHIAGKTTLTLVTPIYLALTVSAVVETDTGPLLTSGAKEATYTGYARKSVAATDWASAVAGSPGSIANANALTFANCTGGSNTIIGWALLDASTINTGNIIMFGTCTSVVISSTQTPPTIAIGALSMTLD